MVEAEREKVDEHDVVKWEITRRADGASVGTVGCVCGWTAEVGPSPAMSEADQAVKAAWSLHLDDTSTS